MDNKEFIEGIELFYASGIQLIKRKNADYTGGTDPFANFLLAEKMGVTSAEKALMVRMCDKVARLATLIDKDAQVKDESFQDTALDLCNYCAILSQLRKDRRNEIRST